MRAQRVLYLVGAPGVPLCGPSGASNHVRGFTGALARLGHQVELVGVKAQDVRGVQEAPQVAWTAAGAHPWRWWPRSMRHLAEVATGRRVAAMAMERSRLGPPVDLVVERHALYSDAGLRVARALKVPLVLEVNAPQAMERNRFESPVAGGASRRWERRVLRSADVLLAVSSWLVRWLVEEAGCSPEKVIHLPNGVAAGHGDRQGTRRELGFEPDDLVVGFVGSNRPWHGVEILEPLLRKLPDARLLLVGALPPGGLPFSHELAHRVVSTGQVPSYRVPALVAASDVGVAPYPEGAPPWFCPLKLLDYRAQGTPVVASDVGDNLLLVGDGGTVVPAGDVDAMAAAVLAWRGRRTEPSARTWEVVAREALEAVARATAPGASCAASSSHELRVEAPTEP